ncbi:GNAT family N-acetyltransferase [Flavobacterium sp. LS1R47]|jgi:GNAT superfamily N-acetyltransferase|uniref:GNAT family N-acetyltransferase n=1 Tax=Flavobacterium frigoritolerans TaxID=2987686 RepID=A0A9X2YZ32_9FLAO|nr:GNAT family N-acetyltransferase [Flavobacterium frigoritolerans]MCV9932073.1 GNAT family N-acetyltransferase [Flavobacterium frigoritolerans]
MTIKEANSYDHEILTEITKKSKAFWGYSGEQIEVWSEFLTVSKEYIETNPVYNLIVEDKIIGYYSFFHESENTIKLDNLFVFPEFIGKGFGKVLLNDFLNRLKDIGVQKVVLNSEPNAEAFYTKFGFVKIGQIETSIKDRFLPIMELNLEGK